MKKIAGLSFLALFLSSLAVQAESYLPGMAKTYAINHVLTPYGSGNTKNPFPDLYGNAQVDAGNCTNFANQAISGGLLNTSSPVALNKSLIAGKFPKTIRSEWFFTGNSVSNASQSVAWRGAQGMFVYSRGETSTSGNSGRGLRMAYVTRTAWNNGSLLPLDPKLIKVGDIIFADFDFKYGQAAVQHTMIVTATKPESWFDWTQASKYNNVRLTYQNGYPYKNQPDKGLGDVWTGDNKATAFYVYRPTGYIR